jgi:DUF4097 and DUF4098 domain-containing protein YvlB
MTLQRFAVVAFVLAAPGLAAAQPETHPPAWPSAHPVPARAGWHERFQEARSGPVSSEEWSRTFKVGPNGSFDLNNLAGDVVVSGAAGDEIRLEATKRVRTKNPDEARQQLEALVIDVAESAGRVEINTIFPRSKNVRAEVEYVVQVPWTVAVSVRTVAGDIEVSQVKGDVRLDSVSGDIATTGTPRLSRVKSVSGDIRIMDAVAENTLTLGTISGNLEARRVKARAVELQTVSGDLALIDSTCERAQVRSVSGNVEFGGALMKGGRYEFNSHSGDVLVALTGKTGFEIAANTFSGTLRSDLPLTTRHEEPQPAGGRHPWGEKRELRGTFGDGSAMLLVKTFSGSVVVATRGAPDGGAAKNKAKDKEKVKGKIVPPPPPAPPAPPQQ